MVVGKKKGEENKREKIWKKRFKIFLIRAYKIC